MFLNRSDSAPDFKRYVDQGPSHSSDGRPFDANQISSLTGIEIVNGHKWYGNLYSRKKILHAFNMKVPENRLYCLIGPKGCGKTTILRLVAGLLALDKGLIEYRGRFIPVLDPTVIGYMPQEHGLHMVLTLRETFNLHGGLLNLDKEYLQDRMLDIMYLMRFPDLNLKISDMTYEELCRTSFALAFLHEPDFLLLDEPTVGSDAVLRHEFRGCMRGLLMNKRTTIIMTSHDFDEANFCDTVGMMRDGRMIAEGPSNAIMKALGAKSLIGVFYITAVGRGHTDYSRLTNDLEQSSPNFNIRERSPTKFIPVRHFPPRIMIIIYLACAIFHLLTRQVTRILSLFILPALFIILFGLSVGPPPSLIKLSFMEEQKYRSFHNENHTNDTTADQTFSNLILKGLSEHFNILKEVDSVKRGITSVIRGKSHAFLWFPRRANLKEPYIAIYYRHARNWSAPDLELYVDPTQYMMQEVIKNVVVQEFRKAASMYFPPNISQPADSTIIDAFGKQSSESKVITLS